MKRKEFLPPQDHAVYHQSVERVELAINLNEEVYEDPDPKTGNMPIPGLELKRVADVGIEQKIGEKAVREASEIISGDEIDDYHKENRAGQDSSDLGVPASSEQWGDYLHSRHQKFDNDISRLPKFISEKNARHYEPKREFDNSGKVVNEYYLYLRNNKLSKKYTIKNGQGTIFRNRLQAAESLRIAYWYKYN